MHGAAVAFIGQIDMRGHKREVDCSGITSARQSGFEHSWPDSFQGRETRSPFCAEVLPGTDREPGLSRIEAIAAHDFPKRNRQAFRKACRRGSAAVQILAAMRLPARRLRS